MKKVKMEKKLSEMFEMDIKIHSAMESLFSKGGTMNEDYIVIRNKKIGLSKLKDLIAEYEENIKENKWVVISSTYGILRQGGTNRWFCDEEQFNQLYALGEVLKNPYITLLIYDLDKENEVFEGFYTGYYEMTTLEELEAEVGLEEAEKWIITEYGAVKLNL